MACFLVPAAEAVVTTIVTRTVKKKEKELEAKLSEGTEVKSAEAPRIKLSEKLNWLNIMLWGGSLLLMLEHIWHGEVVPWFPFLTAASSAEETSAMLHEMATVGVCMALLVTAVWAGMVFAANAIVKRQAEPAEQDDKEYAV
ncbi:MAG: hypothetical protein IJ571_07580 [Ruminococcus sp.]|nr:hypothetical protein [Ruminococcus sp.]